MKSPTRWVYTGDQRFEQQKRDPAEIPGTWTQFVYEVNDAPRYSGNGRWNHDMVYRPGLRSATGGPYRGASIPSAATIRSLTRRIARRLHLRAGPMNRTTPKSSIPKAVKMKCWYANSASTITAASEASTLNPRGHIGRRHSDSGRPYERAGITYLRHMDRSRCLLLPATRPLTWQYSILLMNIKNSPQFRRFSNQAR